jgi:hypothetical protein
MLDGLKRLFSRTGGAPEGWPDIAEWARARQFGFRPVRGEASGFVVEGRLGAQPWRLEWGPPQRPYIEGPELRVRAELGLPSDLQVLVLDRLLQATMEKAVFEQYVESVQTRIDDQTPPEMRWLVMYGKLVGAELGPLRDRFAAVSQAKAWLQQWLDGALAGALLQAPLVAGQPLVLMISRGRLTLRTALAEPEPPALDAWLRLFHQAMREARRVADLAADPGHASTQPSMFHATRTPGDDDPR